MAPPQAGPVYVHAFMSVLKAVSKEETVQYVLALLLQMLQGGKRVASSRCCKSWGLGWWGGVALLLCAC